MLDRRGWQLQEKKDHSSRDLTKVGLTFTKYLGVSVDIIKSRRILDL